ncbi:MAG: hypothetical protein HC803_09545, partial [Saprospiraceae bacterium]|nr:hypothetical protein [Saprospiraceae bacterium]
MKLKIYSLYKIAFAICILGGFAWWFTSKETTNVTETEKVMRTTPSQRWQAEFEMLRDPVTGEIPKGIEQKAFRAALKTKA